MMLQKEERHHSFMHLKKVLPEQDKVELHFSRKIHRKSSPSFF